MGVEKGQSISRLSFRYEDSSFSLRQGLVLILLHQKYGCLGVGISVWVSVKVCVMIVFIQPVFPLNLNDMNDGAISMTLNRLRLKLHNYLLERGFEL